MTLLFWSGCDLPDNSISYEEGLVVFGNIDMFEINEKCVHQIL